ncbi:MAG: hypothetical protein K8I01_10635 [Candidatus Methylomirabilis sp.]|nr:hypothetical protein [Deltaproteobacteria bacterium]
MYAFLRTYLPKGVADVLIILWYLLLIFMAVVYSTVETEGFRYLNV